jgi:hypothetical protein
MKKLCYLLLVSSISLTVSCIKFEETPPSKPTLPPLTKEGLNTLGCFINNELWVAEIPPLSEITGIRHLEAFFHPQIANPPRENYFAFKARKTNQSGSLNQVMIAEIENVQSEGTYEIIYSKESYWNRHDDNNCSEKYFKLDTFSLHEVILTRFDTLERIASGTFSFTLINQECSDTLKITSGRFDTQFKP